MEKNKYKIVIIGESNVGKTSLITRYTKNTFTPTSIKDRTVNAYGTEKTIYVNENILKLSIWDTAGEEKYHALTPMYYRDAHGLILVFDLTNLESFQTMTKWIEEVKSYTRPDIKIILCGNKCDLQDQQQINFEDARKYLNKLSRLAECFNANYLVCSAKNDVNVSDLFSTLALGNQFCNNVEIYHLKNKIDSSMFKKRKSIKIGEIKNQKEGKQTGGCC